MSHLAFFNVSPGTAIVRGAVGTLIVFCLCSTALAQEVNGNQAIDAAKGDDLGNGISTEAENEPGGLQPAVEGAAEEVPDGEIHWFDTDRTWFAIILAFVCGSVLVFIGLAARGMQFTVRKIAGLEATEEAVGRATEMGRPCLFVPGIQDMNQIDTVAGVTLLGHVAEAAARYDATVVVPTAYPLVMTAAREAMHAAYLTAGRPEAYNEDNVFYVTQEQFGYVAAVTGMMARDRPAACFYFGKFYAESLLLAETGNMTGAMQIAGTAMPAQLPFFVAACDYTLIGEEFFAARAYLSGEPQQLGSLKGQDVGKVFAATVLILGCLLKTAADATQSEMLQEWVSYLQETILT